MATNLGRISPTRVLIVFAALVALVLAGGFVWKHWFEPRPLQQISSVAYHQYQAILDFDDAEYTQDDAAQLAKLQQLLEKAVADEDFEQAAVLRDEIKQAREKFDSRTAG
jgi:hypothetical protein